MSDSPLTPQKHKDQITAYSKVVDSYRGFAATLRRVLQDGCRASLPEALIQAREKSLSSFAEKVARKAHKYNNPLEEFTDLCAARVIVQTLEQVAAVCEFIEGNFEIIQKDDKGLHLGESTFGYRDMHYLVRLQADRDALLGVTKEERETIQHLKNRTAEIQVRTWLQHAWADTLHDRTYKNSLRISGDLIRSGNLLAAQMEEGDRGFDRLAGELDGMIANYTASTPKADVEKEIGIQELILDNEPDPAKKPVLALRLARLYALRGEHGRVVKLLEPFHTLPGPDHGEVLLELGFALCRSQEANPHSSEYQRGLEYLEVCVRETGARNAPFVHQLRKRRSLRARVQDRLGWALGRVPGKEDRARLAFLKAHEHEPGNPYYLAGMLGAEMRCAANNNELAPGLRPIVRGAVETCLQHGAAGIELPFAYFTAGRLLCLLDGSFAALGWYARGVRYCLEGRYFVSEDAIDDEVNWLLNLHQRECPPAKCHQILTFLSLAARVFHGPPPEKASTLEKEATPVLIIAGGEDNETNSEPEAIRPILAKCLEEFKGTVISTGTTARAFECIDAIAQQIATEGQKRFSILTYHPEQESDCITPNECGDQAANEAAISDIEQILRYWSDIIAAGIPPRDVLLLGLGGGQISALEYRIALGFGATVGLVAGTSEAANALLGDTLWSELSNFLPLVSDPMTLRSFVMQKGSEYDQDILELMAQEFHSRYISDNISSYPDKLKPWTELKETFKRANLEQAAHAVRILESAGFCVRRSSTPVIFDPRQFSAGEIERMAEMEHGRWNMERLCDGWRFGRPRDDQRQLHDCLVPWKVLPDTARKYDREAVLAFPRILAKAGFEICRPGK